MPLMNVPVAEKVKVLSPIVQVEPRKLSSVVAEQSALLTVARGAKKIQEPTSGARIVSHNLLESSKQGPRRIEGVRKRTINFPPSGVCNLDSRNSANSQSGGRI